MAADVKVIQVPEGSIVVLTGLDLGDGDEEGEAFRNDLIAAITQAAGHMRFVLLHLPLEGSDAEVWGPDVDLEAKVRELLARGGKPAV